MFFNELPNNTSQQLPLIVVGFGFTPAESALFNIVKPIWGSGEFRQSIPLPVFSLTPSSL